MVEPAKMYVDFLGEMVPYDGQSPVSWRVSAYAVAVQDAAILLVEPVWATRWELSGGEVELENQETLADGAGRECSEETGYRFTPTEGPMFLAESFFFLRSPGRYCHSLMFTVRGTVASQPDPAWRSDPEETNAVRWVPLASLTEGNVHQPHWDALRRLHLA